MQLFVVVLLQLDWVGVIRKTKDIHFQKQNAKMSGEQEPHTNGVNGDASDDEDQKNMRPVDIEADVKEMERRKRVEAIMNSQVR